MNTMELQYILNHAPWLKQLHGRVLPKDLLPQQREMDVRAFIVNTDDSDLPGRHWVSVYFSDNGDAYYFDSYGLPPIHEEILQFLKRHSKQNWISQEGSYNHQRVQSLFSNVCGLYCVFALDTLARGYNIQHYLRHTFYPSKFFKNDQQIIRWFREHYGTMHATAQRQTSTGLCQRCSPKEDHHEMTLHHPKMKLCHHKPKMPTVIL